MDLPGALSHPPVEKLGGLLIVRPALLPDRPRAEGHRVHRGNTTVNDRALLELTIHRPKMSSSADHVVTNIAHHVDASHMVGLFLGGDHRRNSETTPRSRLVTT